MKIVRKQKYPYFQGRPALEIKIKSIDQLFDQRDPAPFRSKDLDDDAVEYIVTSLKEHAQKNVDKLLVFISEPLTEPHNAYDIAESIHTFFSYEAEQMRKKIKNILKMGLKSLLIGLVFLSIAISTSMWLKASPDSYMGMIFKEGLILLGWVSMWKPINIFLYDWWPLADLLKTYKKLSQIEIDILQASDSCSQKDIKIAP